MVTVYFIGGEHHKAIAIIHISVIHTFWCSKETLALTCWQHIQYVLPWLPNDIAYLHQFLNRFWVRFPHSSQSGVECFRFHTINQSHKNLFGSAPRPALVFISVQLTVFTSAQPGQSSNSTNQLRCESILWLICDNWLWYHCENIPALFYILSLS